MNDAGRLTDEGFDQINEALYQFASENNMNNAAARNFVRETVGEIEAEGARLANAGADATADAAGAGARRGADDAPRVDEAPAPPRAGNMLTPEQTAIVRRAQQDAAQISSDLSTESLRHGSEALANINQRMVNIRAANELNVGEEIVGNTPREILEGLQAGGRASDSQLSSLESTLKTIANGQTPPRVYGSGLISKALSPITNMFNKGANAAADSGPQVRAFSQNNVDELLDGARVSDLSRSWSDRLVGYANNAIIGSGALMATTALVSGIEGEPTPESAEVETSPTFWDNIQTPGFMLWQIINPTDGSILPGMSDITYGRMQASPAARYDYMRDIINPALRGMGRNAYDVEAVEMFLKAEGTQVDNIDEATMARLIRDNARGFEGYEHEGSMREQLYARLDEPSGSTWELRDYEVTALAEYVTPRLPEPAKTLPEAGRLEFVRMYGYENATPQERVDAEAYRERVLAAGPSPLQRQVLTAVDLVIANEENQAAATQAAGIQETVAQGIAGGGPVARGGYGGGRSTAAPQSNGFEDTREQTAGNTSLDIPSLKAEFIEFQGLLTGQEIGELNRRLDTRDVDINGNGRIDSPAELDALKEGFSNETKHNIDLIIRGL